MHKKHVAVTIFALLILVVVVLGAYESTLRGPVSTGDATYTVPTSAIRTSLGTSASDGKVALRLNSISDTSNGTTRATWMRYNTEARLDQLPLIPPSGSRYLVANVTVTNVHGSQIPFSYAQFALLSPNGTAYYPNVVASSSRWVEQIVRARTLNDTFSGDVYVLFSVPAEARMTKLVYTASSPPIVTTLP